MISKEDRIFKVAAFNAYKHYREIEVMGRTEVGITLGQLVLNYPILLFFDGKGSVSKYTGKRTTTDIAKSMDLFLYRISMD